VCNNGDRSRVGACPPPRNVAAKERDITDSLISATLWGGVGGGETRQIAVTRPLPRPVNGYVTTTPSGPYDVAPAEFAAFREGGEPIASWCRYVTVGLSCSAIISSIDRYRQFVAMQLMTAYVRLLGDAGYRPITSPIYRANRLTTAVAVDNLGALEIFFQNRAAKGCKAVPWLVSC
jgi:hypothetical protein